ncbi:hypothetical protein HII31_04883 [Pseudocercospora fuligena]|uniref:Small secreted protein n=1 Tax=Pseudocercospora fuligena TaxID=685502 RepID=A0A8H6VMQ4_9PEZI|nr:hypothetical protein HII31_04883 [Pseudocercospora fuligena]
MQPHTSKMHFSIFTTTISLAVLASATLDPATSNSKNRCPTTYSCEATKISKNIQAAECSHNTRTHEDQTFAVFVTDHKYDDSHGAPYGTCSAYTCEPPATPAFLHCPCHEFMIFANARFLVRSGQMKDEVDCWTFFWEEGYGKSEGKGAGCIKSPDDGTCGCENSDGEFIYGGDDCE